MAAGTTRAGAQKGSRASTPKATFPKLSVFRLEEALLLVERLVAQNTDVFIAAGQAYREKHRKGTSRPLNAIEVATIAGGLATSLADAKTQIDEAGLTHHDEPEPQELLFAAGMSTSPAFLRAALRLTALLELPSDVFENAREDGPEAMDAAIDEHIETYGDMEVPEMRARASAALARMSQATGVEPGKAWELVQRIVTQGLGQALGLLTSYARASSESPSSTASPASTTGPGATSATTSPGEKPSD